MGIDGGETRSTIEGGIQQGPVLQGRDFSNLTFVTSQAAAAPVARAQLPAPVPGFTGRQDELAELAGLLDPARSAGAVVVSAVAGLAGVGKTALAVQAGHAARDAGWFPGGVLFIDLHGYDDAPVQAHQALDSLLRALGVAAEHIPPGAEDRAGLYRSLLAQVTEPLLVIADNASSEAQVRLLLPGPGPHRVVITSRHTLAGLGARLLDVTVLDEPAAVALLAEILRATRPGDDRISADPTVAAQLAEICAGLPLALRIAGALLAADPALAAADLAGELREEAGRLEALAYDDGGGTSALSVAAAFELSYRQLDPAAALLFRLLPVDPGPDVSTAAAAALAGRPLGEIRRVIGRLVRAHLVEPASGAGRWRMHDLLRLYAGELSDANAVADDREQARGRLLAYYLNRVDAADNHLRALPGIEVPAGFTSRDDALAWLDAERPNLLTAIALAVSIGRDQVAMRLPVRLSRYLSWRRRFDDWIAVSMISRDAARRQGNRSGEAVALNSLGLALVETRRSEEAIGVLREAMAICREIGDRNREGRALNNLGMALRQVRRFEEAIDAHQEAMAIYRETGDRHREANALGNLGVALQEARRFEEAIGVLREAMAICRETGDRNRQGKALNDLGAALRRVRRFEEAIGVLREAMAICRETGDRHIEGMVLNNLGLLLQELRRFEEAIGAHREAVAIYQETGDRYREGRAMGHLEVARTAQQDA